MNTSELTKKFSGVRVLLIGDFMLDHYIQGDVSRISPEAPVQIVNVIKERSVLGGAGNVATNIAALNGKVNFLFLMNKKDENVEKLLEKNNIKGIPIYDSTRKTTIKKRIMGMNQQLLRLDYEDTHQINEKIESEIIEKIEKNLNNTDIMILSDYAKGLLTPNLIKKIIELANNRGIKTVIDPKPKTIKHCKKCYILTPNHIEASKYAEIPEDNGKEIIHIGKKISSELDCNLLITRGEKGMALFEKNREPYLQETKAKQVYDVTGAGDTVTAIMALSIGADISLRESTELANKGAGIVVGKRGTATLSPEELFRN